MFYQYYKEKTWEQIKNLDKNKCYLLFPVAAVEQHGPHLPVGTDDFILDMCMEELLQNENKTGVEFLCLPKLSVGQSAEHMTFPGTLSFSVTTYQVIIHDIVASVAKSGFKKLVIVNGHGGNTFLLNGFAQELNLKYGIEIYNLDLPGIYGKCNEAEGLENVETACDIHAGDIETSLLLYKQSQFVHMEKAVDVPLYIDSFYNSWITGKISSKGVMGRPTKASKERGKLILDYMVEHMITLLEKIAKI